MMTSSSVKPEPRRCERCGRLIEPVEIPWPGGTRWLEPSRCPCEVEAWEREQAALRGGQGPVGGPAGFHAETPVRAAGPAHPAAGLGQRFVSASLQNFERRPGTETALKAGQEFLQAALAALASGEPLPAHGLYLTGGLGAGKTRLAASIINDLYAQAGVRGMARVVADWLEDVRRSYGGGGGEGLEAAARSAPILLLDDVGAERVTDWVQERLFLLIDHRYRHSLPTLFTSNLKPNELADRIGERIVSRIVGMARLVIMDAEDFRLQENRRLLR